MTHMVSHFPASQSRGASMDANLNQQLAIVAVAMSAAALFFSLLAAFPGLKGVLPVVRDGVLWFVLFMALGAGGFMIWQSAEEMPQISRSTAAKPVVRVTAEAMP
jgi:uncharacterized membrane protein